MGLRLSHQDRKAFMEKYQSTIYVQYGRAMNEYVAEPGALLSNTKKLKFYLEKNFKYAKTLKPRPTKRM